MNRTHGLKHGKNMNLHFYRKWTNMKRRCLKKNDKDFKHYGGRGIKICKKWLSFTGFMEDMYDSYLINVSKNGKKNTELDRSNNEGNYCKKNCRWADRIQQNNNTRRQYKKINI